MKELKKKALPENTGRTTVEESTLLEQVFLSEISGKNCAIQSYDDIIWKIRTGYLTLFFAGWAILLTGMVESARPQAQEFVIYIAVMFLFSLGLTVGGFFIDSTYTQRKAKVICALDRLTNSVGKCGGDLKKISLELLQISGDDPDAPYDKKRYHEALRGAACVYFVPLATVVMAGGIILVTK